MKISSRTIVLKPLRTHGLRAIILDHRWLILDGNNTLGKAHTGNDCVTHAPSSEILLLKGKNPSPTYRGMLLEQYHRCSPLKLLGIVSVRYEGLGKILVGTKDASSVVDVRNSRSRLSRQSCRVIFKTRLNYASRARYCGLFVLWRISLMTSKSGCVKPKTACTNSTKHFLKNSILPNPYAIGGVIALLLSVDNAEHDDMILRNKRTSAHPQEAPTLQCLYHKSEIEGHFPTIRKIRKADYVLILMLFTTQ